LKASGESPRVVNKSAAADRGAVGNKQQGMPSLICKNLRPKHRCQTNLWKHPPDYG